MAATEVKKVVEAFRAAARKGDIEAALAVCTPKAAEGQRDESVLPLLSASDGEDPFDFPPAGPPHVHGDRAAMACAVVTPEGDAPGEPVWLLLVQADAGWRIDALWESKDAVALFLAGTVPAHRFWEGLDKEPAATRWAKKVSKDLDEGNLALKGPAGEHAVSELQELRELGELRLVCARRFQDRRIVGFQVDDPRYGGVEERWVVVEPKNQVRACSPAASLDALIEGLDIPWPSGDAPAADQGSEDQASTSDDKKSPPSLDEVEEMLGAAVSKAMDGLDKDGNLGDAAEDAKKQVPAFVQGLFRQVFDAARNEQGEARPFPSGSSRPRRPAPDAPTPQGSQRQPDPPEAPADGTQAQGAGADASDDNRDPVVVDLAEERRKRDKSLLDGEVGDRIRGAVHSYVSDHVDGDEPEVQVDADFLKEHGPAMLTAVFQAVTKSLVPEDLEIDLAKQKAARKEEDATNPADSGEAKGGESPAEEGADRPSPKADDAEAQAADKDQASTDEPRPVRLKLDLGGLLQGVVQKIGEGQRKRRDDEK